MYAAFEADQKTKIVLFNEAKLGLDFVARAFLVELLCGGGCGLYWYYTPRTIKPFLEYVTFMIPKSA